MEQAHFVSSFQALTGNQPFRWQARLFQRLVDGKIPQACDIPTGLGKTSVVVLWLLALAWQAREGAVRLPRRLVYVVDRRTVVDQATDIAVRLRTSLRKADGVESLVSVRTALNRLCADPEDEASPVAISTLRGQFADNREWQEDPARAAIIVGTVDMIGSRLLFSGYGVSRKMRPFHAGLIGQDALILHDEAHLSPAFGALIAKVAATQTDCREPRPVRVVELSATQRGRSGDDVFRLTEEDLAEAPVTQRLQAWKELRLHAAGGKADEQLAELATAHDQDRARVLVYVRTPNAATEIAKRIRSKTKRDCLATLTGTLRGHERDDLVKSSLFEGFRARPGREPPAATEYLVATSAGEVGVDLDADHMICDLTSLDSMIQRLGRVNRLGEGCARIDILLPKDGKSGEEEAARLEATRAALAKLPPREDGFDASPAAIRELLAKGLTEEEQKACFSETPRLAELTDILLDGWAMTSVESLPGRPSVDRWLRGVTSEPPSVYLAWRTEVDEIIEAEDRRSALDALFETHPILAQERLRAPLRQDTIGELKPIAKRLAKRDVILVPAEGKPEAVWLEALLEKENLGRLAEATLVLPPDAGGLRSGMLDGTAEDRVLDVADAEADMPHAAGPRGPGRLRVLIKRDDKTAEWLARRLDTGDALDLGDAAEATAKLSRVARMGRGSLAEKRRIVLAEDEETSQPVKVLLLLADPGSGETAEENSGASAGPQTLSDHLSQVRAEASRLVARIGELVPHGAKRIAEAVILAAEWHDRGKDRDAWQADIGHARPRGAAGFWEPWAKSGRRGFVSRLSGEYRHELGSLREASADLLISEHPERELILHLIAAHHGWARPHFEVGHWDIAEGVDDAENEMVAAEAMRRFARLERRFGHWGLAWLEALLRAADYKASRRIASAAEDEPDELRPAVTLAEAAAS